MIALAIVAGVVLVVFGYVAGYSHGQSHTIWFYKTRDRIERERSDDDDDSE